jgi:hypothetical protein
VSKLLDEYDAIGREEAFRAACRAARDPGAVVYTKGLSWWRADQIVNEVRAERDQETTTGIPIPPPADDIDATLTERGNRYGAFPVHAQIAQDLKRVMQETPNWASLPADMKEALEMNAHKTARILNGDPFFHDSWHDIVGYTKLVADRLAR